MQNQKKTVVIINEFPKIIYEINPLLHQPNVDFVLDASDYPKPLALLTVAFPDILMLNLNLSKKTSSDVACSELQNNPEINRAMITTNAHVYYMSLCSTFKTDYSVSNQIDLELLPQVVERQQFN